MMVGEIFEEMPSDGKVATGFLTETDGMQERNIYRFSKENQKKYMVCLC